MTKREEPGKLLSERIRECREKRGLAVEQAASMIGVEAEDWRGFEDGTREPLMRHGLAIATLFDVKSDWLAGLA